MVATGVATMVVEKAGRRLLLMLSIGVMAFTIGGLGAYFYLEELSRDNVSSLGNLARVKKNKAYSLSCS